MARTSMEIAFNGKSIDEITRIFESAMLQNKYSNQIIKGENVWAKGDGVIVQRQCFSISFTENSVILQGWMGDAIMGESALTGFMACFPKKKMRSIMESIASQI